MWQTHDRQAEILAFMDLEERVPEDHPLRTIKAAADEALEGLSPEFESNVVACRSPGPIDQSSPGSLSHPVDPVCGLLSLRCLRVNHLLSFEQRPVGRQTLSVAVASDDDLVVGVGEPPAVE